jgi:hypothetical protein
LFVAWLAENPAHAQSANKIEKPPITTWSALSTAQKPPLYTYYGDVIPKDGHLLDVPMDGQINFVACDRSLIKADTKQLIKLVNKTDCGEASKDDDRGMITGYIKGYTAKGDVMLLTRMGSEVIEKDKWDQLISHSQQKGSGWITGTLNAGDFAAFEKNEGGHFAAVFKLAPNRTEGDD